MYVIKDLFGVLVIVSVNLNCKCKKKLVDKLIEKCTEDIEETRLVEKTSDKNKK